MSARSAPKRWLSDAMLGFLPAPVPDELLYSVVARYGAITGQGTGTKLTLDAFGTSVGIAAIDLPRRIGSFLDRLPPGHGLDVSAIINGHTLFPYLLRFAPPQVADSVFRGMADEGPRRPPRLGVMAASFPTPERLMLCPKCAREDSIGSDLGAWRRVHQLPGVLVCPRHGTPLAESQAARIHRRGRAAFMPVTQDVITGAKRVPVARGAADSLLKFACATDRLLNMVCDPLRPSEMQRRLRDLLVDFRWARAPSLLHTAAMVKAFKRHPPIRVLFEAMNVSLADEQLATALNRLLYRDRVTKHPLLVLIMLELAGASLDDLWAPDVPAQVKPEPSQPRSREAPAIRHDLPCGNPACQRHRGELAATLADGLMVQGGVQAVCQDCDFAYVWNSKLPRKIALTATGLLWDRLLAEKLTGGSSLRAVGREVGVSPTTVMRHARRLGMWRAEWTDRPKVQLRQATAAERILERHRANWIEFRTSEVSCPAKKMPKAPFNAYRFLIRKDREWLQRNHPMTRRAKGTPADCAAGTQGQAMRAGGSEQSVRPDGDP
jgi:hypothetical protein